MIIDCHGHVSAPAQLWAYKAGLLASRGSHGRGGVKVSDDEMRAALNASEIGPTGHLDALHDHGTDVQLISPRPFQLMHSEKPAKLVHWFAEECHNIIHRQTQMYPNKFFGVASLPQVAGDPIERALPELERCVKQLGFVGCLLNPDPYENSGIEPPALGDRYWYPLYEKLCELDIPAHIHTASSRSERASYSVHLINEGTIAILGLLNSDVFKDFPNLKIIVSHGGGAIPYQLGRFDAPSLRGRGADAVPRPTQAALFRYGALHGAGARAADQDGRSGSLPVRLGMPWRRLHDRSGYRAHDGSHPSAHREVRMAVGSRPRKDLRRQRAQGVQTEGLIASERHKRAEEMR